MALVLADRVKETSGTTGTGDFSLAGATTGFQRFADTVGDGNTTYYAISLVGGGQFEVGRGTYIAATNSITRDEVFDSSNNGSLVSFTTGTKDVFVVYPSGRAVTVDGSTVNIPNSATVPVSGGGTGASSASSARSNLGLGTISTQDANNVNIDGGSIIGITDLAIADGGTGASTESAARTNLGLEIGTDVQAFDANTAKLDATTANFTGTLQEGGQNVVTADEVGTIASQDSNNVSITGGSISGITDLAIADGGTGASTSSTARSNLGLGSIATQDANSVNIDGGSIDGTSVGLTTPDTGDFTNFTASGTAEFTGTGAVALPDGTQAQRPGTPLTGMLRFNTDLDSFEGYDGVEWGEIGGGGGGATGGGTDAVFIQNDQTVTSDYTIPADQNAMSTGPIEIDDGVTVTISSGSRWVVI
jgi:hypothetical protein